MVMVVVVVVSNASHWNSSLGPLFSSASVARCVSLPACLLFRLGRFAVCVFAGAPIIVRI